MNPEQILRAERETRKYRAVALLFVALGAYLERDTGRVWPAAALGVGYLAYVSLLLAVLVPRVPPRRLPYLMLGVDVAFVSGTLYALGVDSPFMVFFPVLIVYYAIFLRQMENLVSAALVGFAYTGLAFEQLQGRVLEQALSVQLPLFYLLAIFSGYLVQLQRREQRERQEISLLLQAERGARATLDVTAAVAATLRVETVLQRAVRLALSASRCTHGAAYLPDEASGDLGAPVVILPAVADDGADGDSGKPTAGIELEAFETGTVVEGSEPDTGTLPAWAHDVAASYAIGLPLRENGTVKGVLLLLSTEPRQALTVEERNLLREVAAFSAPLIAGARAYAAAEKQRAKLSSELRGAVQQIVRQQQRDKKSEVRVGQLLLDPSQEQAMLGTKRLELSSREFDVLFLLAQRAGQTLGQEVMLREIWGDQPTTRSNVVDVVITRLRRKLALQIGADGLIRTVRGAGYLLDDHNAALFKPPVAGSNGAASRGQREQGPALPG